jgi:hypothetical protein
MLAIGTVPFEKVMILESQIGPRGPRGISQLQPLNLVRFLNAKARPLFARNLASRIAPPLLGVTGPARLQKEKDHPGNWNASEPTNLR